MKGFFLSQANTSAVIELCLKGAGKPFSVAELLSAFLFF